MFRFGTMLLPGVIVSVLKGADLDDPLPHLSLTTSLPSHFPKASLALRFDWSQHLASLSTDLSSPPQFTLEFISRNPAPVDDSNQLPKTPLPEPPRFRALYFTTALMTIALVKGPSVAFTTDESMDMMVSFGIVWIMGLMLVLRGWMTGDLLAMWEYEET